MFRFPFDFNLIDVTATRSVDVTERFVGDELEQFADVVSRAVSVREDFVRFVPVRDNEDTLTARTLRDSFRYERVVFVTVVEADLEIFPNAVMLTSTHDGKFAAVPRTLAEAGCYAFSGTTDGFTRAVSEACVTALAVRRFVEGVLFPVRSVEVESVGRAQFVSTGELCQLLAKCHRAKASSVAVQNGLRLLGGFRH